MTLKITLPKGPLALSLSGGGSKGAYTVGMLKHLIFDKGIKNYKIVYGTSTGALIAASLGAWMATKNDNHLYNLIKLYESVENKDILKVNHDLAYKLGGSVAVLLAACTFGGISIFDTAPLESLVDRYISEDDWEKIIALGKGEDPIEIGFCVTNLQTSKSEMITNISHPDRKVLRKALIASTNQPVVMPPIQIFENSQQQYVDGGINDFNPIEKVFQSKIINQVEGILAISLNNQHDAGEELIVHKNIKTMLKRTAMIFSEKVYDTDIKIAHLWNVLLKAQEIFSKEQWEQLIATFPPYIREFIDQNLTNKRFLPIFDVFPLTPITLDALSFRQPEMKNLVQSGYDDAKNIFA